MKNTNQPARRRGPEASLGDEKQSSASRQGARSRGNGAVSPTVARQIDENLKRLYDQHVEQELPPQLQALVARLREGQDQEQADASPDTAPDTAMAKSGDGGSL
jgi:hypothetical protein